MECRIAGCPGQYEEQAVLHLEEHDGEPVVIANVPAKVCDICGDTLFSPQTVRTLEVMQRSLPQPARMIPLYEFGQVGESTREAAALTGARAAM